MDAVALRAVLEKALRANIDGARELLAELHGVTTIKLQSPPPLVVNITRRAVLVDGNSVHCTPIEFTILSFLYTHAGLAVPRAAVFYAVWGNDRDIAPKYERTIDVHVSTLRQKLDRTNTSRFIKTIRCYGFMLVL